MTYAIFFKYCKMHINITACLALCAWIVSCTATPCDKLKVMQQQSSGLGGKCTIAFTFPMRCLSTRKTASIEIIIVYPLRSSVIITNPSLNYGILTAYCLQSAIRFADFGKQPEVGRAFWVNKRSPLGSKNHHCDWWFAHKLSINISYNPPAIRLNGMTFALNSMVSMTAIQWIPLNRTNFSNWVTWLKYNERDMAYLYKLTNRHMH